MYICTHWRTAGKMALIVGDFRRLFGFKKTLGYMMCMIGIATDLDPEELHAHEQADDGLRDGRRLVTRLQLLKVLHQLLLHHLESEKKVLYYVIY